MSNESKEYKPIHVSIIMVGIAAAILFGIRIGLALGEDYRARPTPVEERLSQIEKDIKEIKLVLSGGK